VTIQALRHKGAVSDIDQAHVTAFLSLAAAVDRFPHNSQLHREYRLAIEALRGVGDGESDEFAQFLNSIRHAQDRYEEGLSDEATSHHSAVELHPPLQGAQVRLKLNSNGSTRSRATCCPKVTHPP
jgi:hypothetical protein